jgi:hypothetical protein
MAGCRLQIEELLDDPEIDVVYNPVCRMFLISNEAEATEAVPLAVQAHSCPMASTMNGL